MDWWDNLYERCEIRRKKKRNAKIKTCSKIIMALLAISGAFSGYFITLLGIHGIASKGIICFGEPNIFILYIEMVLVWMCFISFLVILTIIFKGDDN